LKLRTAIAHYPEVESLWDGSVTSPRIDLDLVSVSPTPEIFRQMVRSLCFDVSEMALATHAMAVASGSPITALPIPLWRLLHHNSLVCAKGSKLTGPADLAGRKVAVRAYSQTTGVWIRGILESEYGLDLDSVTWVTLEDSHIPGYQDPPNVLRVSGKGLKEMLLSGEVDAAMGLRQIDPNEIRTVIPDADAAAAAWQRKTGIFPINHVVAVTNDLLEAHPWLGQEILSLFTAAKRAAQGDLRGKDDPRPYGIAPNRKAIETLLAFAFRQKLIPRPYAIDELFDTSLAG
jgi:4,5-dihydroxyphthalate decarboxylase